MLIGIRRGDMLRIRMSDILTQASQSAPARPQALQVYRARITERFTEHDLRGSVGSDAESLERGGSYSAKQTAKSPSASARIKWWAVGDSDCAASFCSDQAQVNHP
jgi:hypothetical protein